MNESMNTLEQTIIKIKASPAINDSIYKNIKEQINI